MKVHEIMTAHARCVAPDNTLVEAAGLMRELDVGALPVCVDDRVVGMVTDRDMVLRGMADGKDPNSATVRDVMTEGVEQVFADQEVEEAAQLMEQRQIRRLPVMSRDNRLVGIVSLGDIAISSNPAFSGTALRDVSEPTHPTPRQRRLQVQSEPRGTVPMNEDNNETRAPRTQQRRPAETRRRSSATTKSSRSSAKSNRQRQSASPARKSATRSRGRQTGARGSRS